jgi:hypothetical protein
VSRLDDMGDEQLERLRTALLGREVTVWLPAGTERRLRGWIQRCNADSQRAGYNDDLFDPTEDLASALVAAAHVGLEIDEGRYGVSYDELTGAPVLSCTMLCPRGHEVRRAANGVHYFCADCYMRTHPLRRRIFGVMYSPDEVRPA